MVACLGCPLQCYSKWRGDRMLLEKDCTEGTYNYIQKLEHVKGLGSPEQETSATKLLELVQECTDNYEFCIHDDLTQNFECLCPLRYFLYRPIIESIMKKEDPKCFKATRDQFNIFLLDHTEEISGDLENIKAFDRDLFSKRTPMEIPLASFNASARAKISGREQLYYEVCICKGNKCNFPGFQTPTLPTTSTTTTKKDRIPEQAHYLSTIHNGAKSLLFNKNNFQSLTKSVLIICVQLYYSK